MREALLFGSDPELFITRPDGRVVAAHSVGIPYLDKSPEVVGGRYFRDGWALELNPHPSENPSELYKNIRNILNNVRMILPKGHGFSSVPCTYIDLSLLNDAPDDVKEFGCNPAYDAYKMQVTKPDVDAKTYPLRSLSGHLHFSGLPHLDNTDNYPDIIKFLDLYVGLPLSIIFSRKQQYERRNFYGKAGEFRPQRYSSGTRGLEYRTPDAQVLNHPQIFLFALHASEWVLRHFPILKWDKSVEADLQEAINKGDEKLQWKLLKEVSGICTERMLRSIKKRDTRFILSI